MTDARDCMTLGVTFCVSVSSSKNKKTRFYQVIRISLDPDMNRMPDISDKQPSVSACIPLVTGCSLPHEWSIKYPLMLDQNLPPATPSQVLVSGIP